MSIVFDPLISSLKVEDKSAPSSASRQMSLDTSLSAVFPVFCSKGQDNVVTENKSLNAIMSRYGDDFNSFSKYGQANIAALGLVQSRGRAFICRLLPDDAKRSYVIFGVYVKEIESITQYERNDTVYNGDNTGIINLGIGAFKLDSNGNKIPIKVLESLEGSTLVPYTLSGVSIRLGTYTVDDPMQFDDEGYPANYNAEVETIGDEKFYPLFSFSYFGRGKGGDLYGFSINRDTGRDKAVLDGRRYYMACYSQLISGSLEMIYPESFYFSFNPEARFSPTSSIQENLSSVYNNYDADGNQNPLQLTVYENVYSELVESLSGYKDDSESVHDIDFINAVFKNGNAYGRIIKDVGSINPSSSVVMLSNGSDGSIDPAAHTPQDVELAKKNLLIKFFRYEIDERILDEKIYDIDICPDCNYPPDVKRTMLKTFHNYRPDIKMVMDVGITKNFKESVNTWVDYIPYINTDYAFMVTVNAHSGTLNDSAIKYPFPVTYTYDYLRGMADNFNIANGAFQMHAGAGRGIVKYFKPYWIARKSFNNMYETLEESGINYIEKIDKTGRLMYGLESTQYMVGSGSKLTSDRNALVVGRAMRICHGVLIKYKFDEREIAASMAAAQSEMNSSLRESNIPNTIGIETRVYQTKDDARNNNAHADIIFTFPDYAQKFIVTIYALRPDSEIPPVQG